MTIEVATSLAGVAPEEWNRLAGDNPFLRHEWVRTWWEAFGTGQLHILVVRAGGHIVGIAPLMRESTQMYGLPVRRIRFLQNDHTPRTDVVVTERPADVYTMLPAAPAPPGAPIGEPAQDWLARPPAVSR